MSRTTHAESDRGEPSLNEPDRHSTGASANEDDRRPLIALGIFLLLAGLRRRSRGGTILAMAGGLLLYRTLDLGERVQRVLESRTPTGEWRTDRTATTGATSITRSVTVGAPPDELYEFWRDPDHLSTIVDPIADITSLDGDRLRWTVDGPAGRELTWETRLVEEAPGEFLRWETPADATVANEWSVRFQPASGDRGTVVTLSVEFDPPGGAFGAATLERLGIVPATVVGVALDRFKSLVESGEIPTLSKNPSARGRGAVL